MGYKINDIKKLREETGAGVLEVKQSLEAHDGDVVAARSELMSKVSAKAAKKSDRTTKDGLVSSYIHYSGGIGSLVLLACETDFVAKTDEFKKLSNEIAMQVCTEDYENIDQLLESEYIKDPAKKIKELIEDLTAKVGEKIELKKFVKYSIED
jgi:elongation factor Ts